MKVLWRDQVHFPQWPKLFNKQTTNCTSYSHDNIALLFRLSKCINSGQVCAVFTNNSLRVWIPLRRGLLDTTLCDKVCQWPAAGLWFSLASSINKTDPHDSPNLTNNSFLNAKFRGQLKKKWFSATITFRKRWQPMRCSGEILNFRFIIFAGVGPSRYPHVSGYWEYHDDFEGCARKGSGRNEKPPSNQQVQV